jgi:hypothetical protein
MASDSCHAAAHRKFRALQHPSALLRCLTGCAPRLRYLGGCEPGDAIPEALAQVLDLVGSVAHVTGNVEASLGFHAVSKKPQAFGRINVGVVLQRSAPTHTSACALPPMSRALARMTICRKQASNAEVAGSGRHPTTIARHPSPQAGRWAVPQQDQD